MSRKRPPVVVIMGHVDHGKTTLLDYIRKTSVASREAGGITQSIGAYEIEHNNQKITFLDTPGHEAFSCMREHGASVADLAILVIAADDSVKPQTKDALNCILESKTPFIVAVNKIDTPGANIEKVKSDLSQAGVYLEGYGGNISWHAVSSKNGEGINELLDLILLATEMENLTYDENAETEGVILMSRLDNRKGNVVSVVLKNGTLKKNDFIATETASGKIKILENFEGKPSDKLLPSSPALIIGFESLPSVGETFKTSESSLKIEIKKTPVPKTENQTEHPKIILKADESGSLEALKQTISKIQSQETVFITESSVGPVTENDAKSAMNTGSFIVAFKSKVDKSAENLIKNQKIKIINSNVIYELEKNTIDYIKKIKKAEVRILEVLAVFGVRKGKEQVIGGKILKGPVKNQESFEIWLDSKEIGNGKILNLQSKKIDVTQAEEGAECGLRVETSDPVAVGHKLIFPN